MHSKAFPTVRLTLLALALVISLGLSVLLNLAVPPPTLRDEMRGGMPGLNDLFDPLAYAHGMYAPEVAPDGMTFRWSGANATLTFPYAAQLGRNMTVGVRLSTIRAPGQPLPNVTIALNGKEAESFIATTELKVYTATLDTNATPNSGLDPAHVQVDISSDAVTIPPDPRQLGVVVDWIEIRPEKNSAEIVLESAVWGITLLAVLIIAIARLPLMWGMAYGLGALISFVLLHLTYLPRGIGLPVEIGLAGLAWAVAAWLAPKARPVWGIGLAVCGLWLVIAGRIMGDWQMDDAYISYRYAWNLLHGHGLVYNPGEVVEGYTNFLWTLFSAIPISLGIPPASVTLAANIALSIGIVALTFHIVARLSGRAYVWPLLAAGLIATDGSIVSYGARGSGMESVLFAFLVLLAAAFLWASQETRIEWRVCGGIAFALASLTRPEGLLVAAVFLGARAWQDFKRSPKSKPAAGKLLLAALVPFLAIVVPYEAWRITFYGYPFPNTFYAKTGATLALIGRGWNYTAYFLGERWLLVALAILGLAFSLFLRRAIRGVTLAFLILIPLYTIYILWIGGDHFPAWRFFVPVVAPLVIVAVDAARRASQGFSLATPWMRWATAMLSLVVSAYIVSALWLQEPESVQAELSRLHNTYVNRWGAAGIWLRDNTPPGTWIAAKGAGAIAYYSEQPVIDMYGLNDLHIGHLGVATMGASNPGHDKIDPQYVLDRHPDYILDEWVPYFQPIKGRVKQDYEYEVIRALTGHDIAWWHRK